MSQFNHTRSMKKYLLVIALLLSAGSANAQKFLVGGSLGYYQAIYHFDRHTTAGYIPGGVRILFIWNEVFQLGAEGSVMIRQPEFFYKDPITEADRIREVFDEQFAGIFFRFRFLENFWGEYDSYFRIGAGIHYKPEYTVLSPDNIELQHTEFETTFGLNLGIGFRVPLGFPYIDMELVGSYSQRKNKPGLNEEIIDFRAFTIGGRMILNLGI